MNHPECQRCELHQYAFNVGIGGRGPIDAKVMIVCMSPGAQEDAVGIPLVGPSGKLLDEMLRDAGFDPTEIRLTNAVRCHSAGNEVTPAQVDACRQWLIEEIHTVKPEVIVAMGDIALRALCKKSGIKSKRGQELELHPEIGYTCPTYATYHPAFVLRSLPSRATVVSDLARVRDRGLEAEKINWQWWPGYLPAGSVLSYDVETDYFINNKTTNNVIQAAVCGRDKVGYVARKPEDIRAMLEGIIDADARGITIVGHNSHKADRVWCNAFLGREAMPMGDDTMVLAYLLDETQPRGLESLCVKYLGVKGWKEGLHAEPDSDEFAIYNSRDVSHTLSLYEHILPLLAHRKAIADTIIKPAFLALEECSRVGIYVDKAAVARAAEHYGPILDELRQRVCELSPESAKVTNPNSTDQMGAALLAEGHILPPTKKTGKPSTTAAVVAELRVTPLTEALSDFREVNKLIGTYIKPYWEIANTEEGRVHSTFSVATTTTGRTTSAGKNVQTIPREEMLQDMLFAKPGYELVGVDYNSIEFRLAAMLAREDGILARYAENPDWDAHSFIACRYFGIDESEGIRLKKAKDSDFLSKRNNVAKSANFGLLFGSSAFGLYEYAKKVGAKLTMAECHNLRSFWHQTFPGFGRYYVETMEEMKAQGYVESLTGRRRHVGNVLQLSKTSRAASLRECINFKVQSLAADIALLGLGLCHKYELPIVSFVHDANYFEFPLGDSEKKFPAIKVLMVNRPLEILRHRFNVEITVPLLVEMKVKANHG